MSPDDEAFPSDGAPHDIQVGGNGPRIWNKIDQIDKRTYDMAKDLAFIKGQLKERDDKANRTFNMKAGIMAAVVSGAISILSLLFGVRN